MATSFTVHNSPHLDFNDLHPWEMQGVHVKMQFINRKYWIEWQVTQLALKYGEMRTIWLYFMSDN